MISFQEHPTNRNKALSPSQQVFVALQFFATGSVLDDSSTIHGVSRATTCRTISRVTNALCGLRNEVRILRLVLMQRFSFYKTKRLLKSHESSQSLFKYCPRIVLHTMTIQTSRNTVIRTIQCFAEMQGCILLRIRNDQADHPNFKNTTNVS